MLRRFFTLRTVVLPAAVASSLLGSKLVATRTHFRGAMLAATPVLRMPFVSTTVMLGGGTIRATPARFCPPSSSAPPPSKVEQLETEVDGLEKEGSLTDGLPMSMTGWWPIWERRSRSGYTEIR